MKLLGSDVLLSFEFFFNFSFPDFVIEFPDNLSFHVLFLLFSGQTSPIKFSVFSEKLFTLLDFWEIHGLIVGCMTLLEFLHLLIDFMFIEFAFWCFYLNLLLWFQIMLEIVQCFVQHFISDLFLQNVLIEFIVFGKKVWLFLLLVLKLDWQLYFLNLLWFWFYCFRDSIFSLFLLFYLFNLGFFRFRNLWFLIFVYLYFWLY